MAKDAYLESKMSKKAVLFDVDGTLIDAYDFVFEAVKHTLTIHKHPFPSQKIIQKALGKSLLEAYKVFAPTIDPLILAKTHDEFQKGSIKLVKLFPKAKKVLEKLKKEGFLLGIVSNRTRKSLHYSLKLAEIHEYFDVVVSVEDIATPKPDKEHVLTALKQLKIHPKNAYMVGDTSADILSGKNAGVKTIGVTYGFAGKTITDHNPDFVIDDLEEILKVLK